jgi:outer membrane protein OmpA-like peptidoglycan-associated protein
MGGSKIISTLILLVVVLLATQQHAHAQRKKKKKQDDVAVSDSVAASYEYVFTFENLNKEPYFYNEKLLKEIDKFEKRNDYQNLYIALRKYVGQFGIQNFYKDTEMLWRLAKLTELYGNYDEAIQLYKLVLKHHREDIDINQVEIYYDSIKKEDKNQYVPLDYYYELVDYQSQVDTLRPPRASRLNMGKLINSKVSDYGPTLSLNDELLIFTSKRNEIVKDFKVLQNEDLFYSQRYGEFWDASKPLKEVNSQYNEGSACLSNDGKTLFFSRCFSPESYGNCDLFVATMQEDSTWGNVHNLGPQVNSQAWDSHPTLSHTGDTLYFASDRIGGFGLSDIYYTYKLRNGNWSRAQNAGPIINTRNNEVSPFYHPKYDVLYFSSNGHLLNFGEFDIFKTNKIKNYWEEPRNIGPLVNSEKSEFYFAIDARAQYLFYAKSQKENMENLDLFSFPLPMEAQPGANTTVSGTLTNAETGVPFKNGVVSIIDLDNGVEVAPKFLNDDGSFEFKLINNQNYLLTIQGEEFFRIEEIFFLEQDMEFNKIAEPISSRINFASIEFDNGKAEIKPSMYGDLYKISDFLTDNQDFKLRISGHTDSDGSAELNMQLSENRAKAIKEFLVGFGGIPEARVEARGYGSTKPIVEEVTEEDKRLNRRVEFELHRPSKDEIELMQRESQDEQQGWNSGN